MKLAVLTPLPPVRSGIAHYNSMLLPALAARHQLTVVVDQPEFDTPDGCTVIQRQMLDRSRFDRILYHLGNNPYHEFAYAEAMAHPGVLVLHDFVLHHLIVESTLARGDAAAYIEQMQASHGGSGAALARGREAGFHGEIGNFLYPASGLVANKSQAVIVHNRYAGESLRRLGVSTPITVVGHPYLPSETTFDRGKVRKRLGFAEDEIVVGMFGFVTAAKRPEVVFEAFARASRANSRLRLLIVGEPAPNIDLESLTKNLLPRSWKALGYVEDDQFEEYLTATDKVVNLRYPSAGETSGALIRVLAAGKPVAVSDYAQFAELPDAIAAKIPFGPGEVAALSLFLIDESRDVQDAQKKWLAEHASLQSAVAGYERALQGANDIPIEKGPSMPALPVLPELRLDRVESQRDQDRWSVRLALTNVGGTRLQAGVFGLPGYRVLAKVFENGQEIFDRWIELPRDLNPGDSARIEFAFRSSSGDLRLLVAHAIEGVPHFDLAPFGSAEIQA